MNRKGDYSQRGVAGKLMLSYLIKNATTDSKLGVFIHLFEEGLKLKNERLTYFALNKIIYLFDKKFIDSHTVVVVFAQLVNKSTPEEIKAQGKLIKFAIAQLTRLSLYSDGCDIAIQTLECLRDVIANSESIWSPEIEKELCKFDDRIKSAIHLFCRNDVRKMGRKTLQKQLQERTKLTQVEEILKNLCINN